MASINNMEEANKILSAYVPNKRTPLNYNLDRMRTLMELLGNPQNQLKIVHIAGTSGKTSTSYYAAALLAKTGKKVGLTISPHISKVTERIQINLKPISDSDFIKSLSTFLEIVEPSKIRPSYFELLVALAYWEFSRQKLDYAVIEVGLGGLLDGTNVVNRDDKICILTDIGLDHVDILGSVISEIAAQKAGIIMDHNEVFCNQQSDEVMNVFREQALEKKATLHVIKQHTKHDQLEFLPLFQQRNFGLAESAVNFLIKRDGLDQLTSQQVESAAHAVIPARMEVVTRGDKTIIMDGAHNAQKLGSLRLSIENQYPGKKIAALASFIDGRHYRLRSSLDELAKITDTLIITSFKRANQDLPYGAIDANVLAELAQSSDFKSVEVISDPDLALTSLFAKDQPILLITGSFYVMEDLRPQVLNQ